VSVYRPCDIRGEAATQLSPSLYQTWGQALGRQVPPGSKFVVGGDVRASTPPFLAALGEGLCQAGLDVVDLGVLPTPMIHYARRRLRAAGCAIVTAACAPVTCNGLTWLLGNRPPTPNDVAALRRAAASSEPDRDTGPGQGRGEGSVPDPGTGSFFGPSRAEKCACPPCRPSAPRSLDVSFDYVACLQETFVESMTARRHVVLDSMFGDWAGKARRYLHAIFPQCLFSTVRDTVDPQFDCREPDGVRRRDLQDLCEAVYRERAHLGLAFDADGLALVDNEGVALRAEEATLVLLQCLADQLPGQRFVYDLKFSDRIPEVARQLGAEPVVERSGRAFIRTRVCDTDALVGADVRGHYFHRSLDGGDDALYTACRLIAHLDRTGKSLGELRRTCPPVYMTPDLRLSVAADSRSEIIEEIRVAWAEFPQRSVDGVRIDTPGGWVLVRVSVTEPALTFRFEGLDWLALDNLVERFCDRMSVYGDELWLRYDAAMGGAARD
jgi:phosphomannomutase